MQAEETDKIDDDDLQQRFRPGPKETNGVSFCSGFGIWNSREADCHRLQSRQQCDQRSERGGSGRMGAETEGRAAKGREVEAAGRAGSSAEEKDEEVA